MCWTTSTLSHCRVLITRPGEQGARLAKLITSHGGTAIVYPVFNIVTESAGSTMQQAIDQLADVDLVIIVSVHAAHSVAAACQSQEIQFPATTKVAAIGPATTDYLAAHGIRVDLFPLDTINSEGLLKKLQKIELMGKKILIFRGQSGRELLAQTLRARGASVIQVQSYQRQLNPEPIKPVLDSWLSHGRQLLIISSVAIARGLVEKVDSTYRQKLMAQTIAVFSERIGVACRNIGFTGNVLVAEQPNDRGVLDAALQHVQSSQSN